MDSSVYCLPADLLGEGAARAELGVDPHSLANAGVHLEEPIYLTEPADANALAPHPCPF